MLLLKVVHGLFTFCHWLFIGTEQVFPSERKIAGTNQWFTSVLSFPLHQVNQNVIFWETKESGFLKTHVPSQMISAPRKLFWYLYRYKLWAPPDLGRFLLHGACSPWVRELSQVSPSRPQSLFALSATHCHNTSGDPPSLRLLPFCTIWI